LFVMWLSHFLFWRGCKCWILWQFPMNVSSKLWSWAMYFFLLSSFLWQF
jgi:hypothetical protein